MKFLVDMPLSPALAQWLRAEGFDAVHASDIKMHLAPTRRFSRTAIQEERVVITADLDFRDFWLGFGTLGPG